MAVINGNNNNNSLFGTKNGDLIAGFAGNDFISGRGGPDKLEGGEGNDFLIGGAGNDSLNGGQNNDYLSGGNGADTLIGGSGNDTLIGGMGNDLMTGGSGNDIFFLRIGQGQNIITDFQLGQDLIGLSGDLSLGQLDWTQNGDNTLIFVIGSGEILASLIGINAGQLNSSSFTTNNLSS